MTTKRRRQFTANFKKRVALEALRGDRTVQAIAAKHEVHPNQVGAWKRQAVDGLEDVFASGRASRDSEHEATIRDLHAKIGELTVDAYFGGSGSPVSAEVDHRFRSKWITDFGGSGSLSAEVDHPVSGVVSAHR